MEFNKNEIADDELLYRMIKRSYPDAFKDGEPQAALLWTKAVHRWIVTEKERKKI